jgi:hypothetical protein
LVHYLRIKLFIANYLEEIFYLLFSKLDVVGK